MAERSRQAETTWLDVADELIDEGVEREESITLSADDLTVDVPLAFGDEAQRARWEFDGTVTVTVDGMRGSIAEWMHLFRETERTG
jgi:hypothetical protein